MAAAEFQVYASFPCVVALDTKLSIDPSNWHWVHCLTLPLDTLNALHFSHRPYKWIRYAIGIVVGAEGDLSHSPDSPNAMNYNAELPAGSDILYYHTSDDEKRRMFPLDPDIGRTNPTSSMPTTRKVKFQADVIERDGHLCTLMGSGEIYCVAVHLLAHSKGDEYIKTYTRHRSRDPTGGNIVQDIDSVRNGLFLNASLHMPLGKFVAFLMTPNFAMGTDDIDPAALPATRRCTAHAFELGLEAPSLIKPPLSGSPLRMGNLQQWPPDILFDAVYAGAVLHHFGTPVLKAEVSPTWSESFYPAGPVTGAHTDTAQNHALERAHYEACRPPDVFDVLLNLPYILLPRDERQALSSELERRRAVADQRRVQEKVNAWRNQVS